MLSHFAALLEPLVQSGYLKPEQVEQVSLGFLKSDRSIVEILESLTQKPLPPSLRKRLLNNLEEFSFLWLAEKELLSSDNFTLEDIEDALLKTKQTGISPLLILENRPEKRLSPIVHRVYKKHYLVELKIVYGVDFLDLDIDKIAINQVAELIDSLIPLEICRRFKLLPISYEGKKLIVGMTDPDNLEAYDLLMRRLNPKKLDLQRMVFTAQDYDLLLDSYYKTQTDREQEKERKKKEEELQKLIDVTQIIENYNNSEVEEPDESEDLSELISKNSNVPVIQLVRKILIKALEKQASEIHIEPLENYLRVRFRQDGVLKESFEPMPKSLGTSILTRLKIMANLDITKKNQPQTGNIQRSFQGKKVHFRLSTLPNIYGEKAFLRLTTNYSVDTLNIEKLITNKETLNIFKDIINIPSGLIIVTGPAESGKSTTLYSVLSLKNKPDINISTVEDSVKYTLNGITQVEVNPKNGLDYGSIIESFLLQDADVILIGETQNKEIGKLAIKAALKGKLVLTTLKSKDTANAISQLNNMDVDPLIISQTLIGVLNQRLIRRVCNKCCSAYQPSAEKLAKFGLSSSEEKLFYQATSLNAEQIKQAQIKGTLCPKCKGIGYIGQIGIYEVLPVSKRVKALIAKNPDAETIKKVAIEEGMKTLLTYALELVFQGETTLEEVQRVLGDELIVSTHSHYSNSDLSEPFHHSHPQLEDLEKQIKTLSQELEQLKNQAYNNKSTVQDLESLQDPW